MKWFVNDSCGHTALLEFCLTAYAVTNKLYHNSQTTATVQYALSITTHTLT
jgi:hypothetical protein